MKRPLLLSFSSFFVVIGGRPMGNMEMVLNVVSGIGKERVVGHM